jgi:hypothetical protein
VRQVARLLAALVLVAGAGPPAPGAPPALPSGSEERPAGSTAGAHSDQVLRQRFLGEWVGREAARNELDGIREIGLDHSFAGR